MTPRATFLQILGVTGLVIFGYYLLINANYLFVHLMALLQLRDEVKEDSWEPTYEPFTTPFLPGIAIVVPAYNEASVIRESVQSLLTVNYPDKEVIVVNDGSTDGTLAELRDKYDLREIEADVPFEIPSEHVRGVYQSLDHDELLVVDKENGGKSDALNAGIWLTEKELFCAVDADSIVDKDSLLNIVRPFLEKPRSMVAVGGTVRVANNCEIEYGQVTEVNLDNTPLVAVQVMEYLRAFYSGRLGLSRLKGLILISGAFGLFRTQVVREIGGYREDTITEDFDLLVRLHRYLIQEGREYDIEFLPQPVIWTEVPESLAVLSRQRRRWYRGMVETLWTNRDMIGNPRYGRIGVYILPFFALAEFLGPLIEGLGYVIIPIAVYFGVLNIEFFILYFVVTTAFGVFLSWFGVYSEVTSFRQYDDPREILSLLGDGVLENFGYRQWKTYLAWSGLFEYLRGDTSWGVMDRTGFDSDTESSESEDRDEDSAKSDDQDGGTDGRQRDIEPESTDASGFVWATPTRVSAANADVDPPRQTAGGDPFLWGTRGDDDQFLWGTRGEEFVWAGPTALGFRWFVGDSRCTMSGLTTHQRPHDVGRRVPVRPSVVATDWFWWDRLVAGGGSSRRLLYGTPGGTDDEETITDDARDVETSRTRRILHVRIRWTEYLPLSWLLPAAYRSSRQVEIRITEASAGSLVWKALGRLSRTTCGRN
jgi:cellulose synthase/poly-beta-1,6-N-acetylglucosamine synthase-like glycosyltransferase